MTLDALHPEALWLMLAAPVLWLVARRTLTDFGRAQLVVMTALRSLIVALLVLALAGIEARRDVSRTAVVVACDVSASVSDASLDRADALLSAIRSRARGPVVVVAFDNEPREAAVPREGRILPRTARAASTDVASALAFARAQVPAGYSGRVVLVTDGRETQGRMLDEAGAFGDSVELVVLALPPADGPEVLLAGLDLPATLTPGATADVTARVESTGPADARLELFLDGFRLGDALPARLVRGENRIAAAVRLPKSGSHEISARITSDNDTVAGNNAAARVLSLPSELRVLIVEEREEDARFLARALRDAGLDADVRASAGFPLDLAELDRYSCVVLSDVPATSLVPAQMELVRRWVEDLGGGFIMVGGESSFGLGGYFHTPIEDLLPVRLDVEKKREEPTLAMVFVLDKSGSMEGKKVQLAKEACLATLELMGPDDLVGVVTFDTEGYLVTPTDRASNRAAIEETIASIRAGGGTNMYPALQIAGRELRRVPARVKHVILLTDGKTHDGDFAGLVRRMAVDGITVSAVAVGAEADVRLLQDVARWGRGRFYFTRDVMSIPQIFARETATASRSAVVEEPFRPRVVRDADVLGGIDFARGPYLLGYVATRPKPLAEVLLASDRSEPVLARTRAGLGRTVAFTSDAKNRWAAQWLSWPGFGKFWAQVVRDAMRPRPSGAADARIDFTGGRATLTVDAADAAGRLRNRLVVEAAVASPGGDTQRLALEQDAPGRYRGSFAAGKAGTYLASVRLAPADAADAAGDVLAAGAVKGAPAEFAALESDARTLSELAGRARGRFLDAPGWTGASADAATTLAAPMTRVASVTRNLASAFLVSALVFFFIDLALRRFDLRSLRRARVGGGT